MLRHAVIAVLLVLGGIHLGHAPRAATAHSHATNTDALVRAVNGIKRVKKAPPDGVRSAQGAGKVVGVLHGFALADPVRRLARAESPGRNVERDTTPRAPASARDPPHARLGS
jgi:hypothetical protein